MLDNRIEKKSVEMNYRNYEGKIVEKYGVELKGWPTSKICNPATLGGRPQLEKLLAALESGQCHWVVLTGNDMEERKKQNQAREERGEQVYRPRKSAVRHSNPKGAKSAETIDDDDEEDGDGREEPTTKRAHNDSENKGEQEPASATKRPRVDDDEEDSNNDKDEADNNHDTTADNTADGNAVDDQYNADNTGMTIGNVAI